MIHMGRGRTILFKEVNIVTTEQPQKFSIKVKERPTYLIKVKT